MQIADINQIKVYRIVHFDNLSSILNNGLYSWSHEKSDRGYINIGNSEIITTRNKFPVKIENYGVIGDYIPFYFGSQSIMLYNILTGYGGLPKQSPGNIVYLCCSLGDLIEKCPKFFFTDGQANKRFTDHFTNLSDLEKVDWETINSFDFKKTIEDPDRPRRYQAEFLVHQHVPVYCISQIIVHNKTRKADVESILANNNLTIKVIVAQKNSYYFYF